MREDGFLPEFHDDIRAKLDRLRRERGSGARWHARWLPRAPSQVVSPDTNRQDGAVERVSARLVIDTMFQETLQRVVIGLAPGLAARHGRIALHPASPRRPARSYNAATATPCVLGANLKAVGLLRFGHLKGWSIRRAKTGGWATEQRSTAGTS